MGPGMEGMSQRMILGFDNPKAFLFRLSIQAIGLPSLSVNFFSQFHVLLIIAKMRCESRGPCVLFGSKFRLK